MSVPVSEVELLLSGDLDAVKVVLAVPDVVSVCVSDLVPVVEEDFVAEGVHDTVIDLEPVSDKLSVIDEDDTVPETELLVVTVTKPVAESLAVSEFVSLDELLTVPYRESEFPVTDRELVSVEEIDVESTDADLSFVLDRVALLEPLALFDALKVALKVPDVVPEEAVVEVDLDAEEDECSVIDFECVPDVVLEMLTSPELVAVRLPVREGVMLAVLE